MATHALNFRVETLERIALGEPLDAIAGAICHAIEQRFPSVVCAILRIDRGGALQALSGPSLPDAYLHSLDNIAIGPHVGSCGTAAYSGHPVEVSDIAQDPRWDGFRDGPLALGLHACSSFPLIDAGGVTVATLALYFPECRVATAEEREMAGIGLHLLDLVLARHTRVEERERRATVDALTGLPNRGSFERTLANLVISGVSNWALLLIDVDDLKVTNDTFGHAAGDRLLQETATRLASLAAPDRTFRIGGDEFAVVVMAPDLALDPVRFARTILEGLAQPVAFQTFSLSLSATVGCARVNGDDSMAMQAFEHADVALHHAKEVMPGGVVLFEPSLNSRIVARISSIRDVEHALDDGRIIAWFQPVIDIVSRRILAFEALCRMRTRDGIVVPAGAFGEAMSDARIASKLTKHMLHQVAGTMRRWRDAGIAPCPIAVNITAADLRGGRLPELVDSAFDGDPELLDNLILEVTEGVYFGRHTDRIIRLIAALRQRGIRIALDDFGTGFASLTHLLTMPVDFIKIDRSFIEGLPQDALSGTIVSAVIAIAAQLGAQVTAEGVETVDQATELARRGCQAAQGWLFAPAVPPDEAARLAMLRAIGIQHGLAAHEQRGAA